MLFFLINSKWPTSCFENERSVTSHPRRAANRQNVVSRQSLEAVLLICVRCITPLRRNHLTSRLAISPSDSFVCFVWLGCEPDLVIGQILEEKKRMRNWLKIGCDWTLTSWHPFNSAWPKELEGNWNRFSITLCWFTTANACPPSPCVHHTSGGSWDCPPSLCQIWNKNTKKIKNKMMIHSYTFGAWPP